MTISHYTVTTVIWGRWGRLTGLGALWTKENNPRRRDLHSTHSKSISALQYTNRVATIHEEIGCGCWELAPAFEHIQWTRPSSLPSSHRFLLSCSRCSFSCLSSVSPRCAKSSSAFRLLDLRLSSCCQLIWEIKYNRDRYIQHKQPTCPLRSIGCTTSTSSANHVA